MTLVIDLFDPSSGPYSYLNAIEYDMAGFESYRTQLWGAQSLIRRGARYFPQLNDGDLFVYPEELDLFAAECHMIYADSVAIAQEIWRNKAQSARIQTYMKRFLSAIDLAKQRNAGVCIS
ncbi:hypothetical protein [Acaryochloris marina]|nr:hypothetical protein [Acaryochloris marina]BDM81772.1 hypothetical protein AM10699_46390 [Acaryochloris marina MBIC10699]